MYFRTKATQNIKYESYIENDMLRVHTEANHSVMTFMGPICLWIGGEWGLLQMWALICRSTPHPLKKAIYKMYQMSLEIYNLYHPSWIITGMSHYLENLILFIFNTKMGRKMKIKKKNETRILKTIFYHILTNFGGSRPKTRRRRR